MDKRAKDRLAGSPGENGEYMVLNIKIGNGKVGRIEN
jgi:hypothetical protein